MAKSKRGKGSKTQQPAPKKRATTPDTSDTDPELVDSSEPRWEPLKIREHYFGTERQMTASQQLTASIEDDYPEGTLQFLTKWKDTPTERWSHDRHDTWEPAEAFLEGSNAIIKYLDRNPELEDNPQMAKFKVKRDKRRERRISHIQREKAADKNKKDEDEELGSDEEAAPAVGAKSPEKQKASSPKTKSSPKKRKPSPEPDHEEEEVEAGADADEESDSGLPAPIDISKSAEASPKATASVTSKKSASPPPKATLKINKPAELAADSEDEREQQTAVVATDASEPDQGEGGAQPNDQSDDDADFSLFDLAPKKSTATSQSSPPPASSPTVEKVEPAPARKEKRKAGEALFRDAGSSGEEEEQPSKKTKLVAQQSSGDEEEAAVAEASKAVSKAVATTSPKKDINGAAVPTTVKERKQHLQKVVASNFMRNNKDTAARKPSPETKEIRTLSQTIDDNGQPQLDDHTEKLLQSLADVLVNNKTPFVGDKNVRSHAKVNKMVTRFWGVRKKFKPINEDQEQSTQTQGPTYLQKHLTGKKAAIYTLKRPVPDQKQFDNDIAALQLLSLSSGVSEVGPLTSAMAEDASQVAVVFIHCTSLNRAGDMERLVEDQLLNKVRVESPEVRFVVVGTKYNGVGSKEATPVFELIFEARVAVSFTSDLVLHQPEDWKERASRCHEMWPTVQMWVHAGAQPKTVELADGSTTSMSEATSQLFSIKYINSSLDKPLTAGLGNTLEDAKPSDFPAEDDLHENDEPDERTLKPHEEAREVVKLAHALRIKYFKVRRWIVAGSPLELTKFRADHSDYPVVEFVDLEGLDPILKELDEGEGVLPALGDTEMTS